MLTGTPLRSPHPLVAPPALCACPQAVSSKAAPIIEHRAPASRDAQDAADGSSSSGHRGHPSAFALPPAGLTTQEGISSDTAPAAAPGRPHGAATGHCPKRLLHLLAAGAAPDTDGDFPSLLFSSRSSPDLSSPVASSATATVAAALVATRRGPALQAAGCALPPSSAAVSALSHDSSGPSTTSGNNDTAAGGGGRAGSKRRPPPRRSTTKNLLARALARANADSSIHSTMTDIAGALAYEWVTQTLAAPYTGQSTHPLTGPAPCMPACR